MSRPRVKYQVRSQAGRWLYDWADDNVGRLGPQSIPVWTHDKDKALVLSAYDAAIAVGKARAAGEVCARVVSS